HDLDGYATNDAINGFEDRRRLIVGNGVMGVQVVDENKLVVNVELPHGTTTGDNMECNRLLLRHAPGLAIFYPNCFEDGHGRRGMTDSLAPDAPAPRRSENESKHLPRDQHVIEMGSPS